MQYRMFNKWFDGLGQAWMKRSPDMAINLCAKNVVYYENPFQKPVRGLDAVRKIWEEVPKSQKDIKFTYRIIAAHENIGVAHWHASFIRLPSEAKAELDGIFMVKLDNKGKCEVFHQWWNSKESEK